MRFFGSLCGPLMRAACLHPDALLMTIYAQSSAPRKLFVPITVERSKKRAHAASIRNDPRY
jgi:hypothetical protein